ncbi:MAG TPA: hypothetical protein VK620_12170 [Bradyrhizobium sp.]|nr:hypothetical protein [Bradyrhizobium sp.]
MANPTARHVTPGDLAGGNHATVALAINQYDQIIQRIGANFIWVDRNGVDQTGIANSTTTKVAFNHKQSDPDGVFDAVTNFRYQPNVAGTFLVCGSIRVSAAGANLTGVSAAIVAKNGSNIFESGVAVISSGAVLTDFASPFSSFVKMNGTSDFLEVNTFIGNSLGTGVGFVRGATTSTFWTAQRIGP